MTQTTNRVLLWQAKSWDRWLHEHGAYSQEHCCQCGKPVKPDAAQLRTVRDDRGEWYVKPIGEPPCADEKDFGECILPIGPDCLKKNPQYRIGLIPLPTESEARQ